MQYSFDGFNYLVRLDRGERLSEVLQQFAKETKIQGAWLSGLGGATQATLGFYDLQAKTYHWQTFDDLHEIVSLTGNLAYDQQGAFVFHLHGVLSDKTFRTVGGHVKDLVAGATVELFVHRAYQPTTRKKDNDTGLQLLELK